MLRDNEFLAALPADVRETDRLTLCILRNFADRNGDMWTSLPYVAKCRGGGLTAARASIRRLVAAGLLVVTDQGNGNRPTRYHLPQTLNPPPLRRVDPPAHRREGVRPTGGLRVLANRLTEA